MVNKEFPWYPESLLNVSRVKEIKSWGFNTVRLGFMWTGAEPFDGQFNATYFEIMGQIVDNLADNGIYAFLDVHQDVLSSYYCLYDGAPKWAVELAEPPVHEFPWPLEWDGTNPCPWTRMWARNYFSEATGKAFQSLYHNYGGMRDKFARFYEETVKYFKERPILGYEILNEPWAGDIYSHPNLLAPGIAGSDNLEPFYDVISETIHKYDPQRLIFYEPVTWGMIFNGSLLGSGFSHVPGGDDWRNASVFSFHYYCWWYTDGSGIQKETCDDMFAPKVMGQVGRDLNHLGGASMLTEWGQGCDPFNNNDTSECNAVMRVAEEYFVGYTDWYFGCSHLMNEYDFNQVNDTLVSTYSRTYAQRINGKPHSTSYNADTRQYDLCYIPDHSSSAFTEIYANFKLHYPQGIDITVSNNLFVNIVDEENNIITIGNRALHLLDENDINAVGCVHFTAKM